MTLNFFLSPDKQDNLLFKTLKCKLITDSLFGFAINHLQLPRRTDEEISPLKDVSENHWTHEQQGFFFQFIKVLILRNSIFIICMYIVRKLKWKDAARRTEASGGSDSEESASNPGDLGLIPESDPWVEKIPLGRKWLHSPIFLPGESHWQKNLVEYSPQRCKELYMTEWLTLLSKHFL